MRRRLRALAIATLSLDSLVAVGGAVATPQPCQDHVCLCVRACPPRASRARACHQEGTSGTAVRATCSHDRTGGLPSAASAVLPAGARLVGAPSTVFVTAGRHDQPAPGFRAVISPPPKHT